LTQYERGREKLMDEKESNPYRVDGLTQEERVQVEERVQREVSHLTRDELAEYIRRRQVALDIKCLELGGAVSSR
jgi:hypothetical protein